MAMVAVWNLCHPAVPEYRLENAFDLRGKSRD
jgi:hypothetical protein